MDAIYILDGSGRAVIDYNLQGQPHSKFFSVVQADASSEGTLELSSSQLVYYRSCYGGTLIVVYGAAESPLRIQDFASALLVVLETHFEQRPTLAVLDANAAAVLTLLDVMIDDGQPVLVEPGLVCSTAPAKYFATDIEYEDHRRQRLQYTNEEIYIDIVEDLTLEMAPISRALGRAGRSKGGSSVYSNAPKPVRCTVHGAVNVLSRLSGDPRVTIDLNLDEAAEIFLHPAVDANQWDRQRTLSLTPPDGRSTAATYTLDTKNTGLVGCELYTNIGPTQLEFEVHVSIQMDTVVKSVDNLSVAVLAPGAKSIKESRLTAGEISADPKKKFRFLWTFGESTPAGWEATLRGTAVEGTFPTHVEVSYSLVGKVPSKTTVKSVQVPLKQKKPYKGVRYRTNITSLLVRSE